MSERTAKTLKVLTCNIRGTHPPETPYFSPFSPVWFACAVIHPEYLTFSVKTHFSSPFLLGKRSDIALHGLPLIAARHTPPDYVHFLSSPPVSVAAQSILRLLPATPVTVFPASADHSHQSTDAAPAPEYPINIALPDLRTYFLHSV